MSSNWPSVIASLDDSLALCHESLRKLEAAEEVDFAAVVGQFKEAEESSRKLQALVFAELPQASWQTREELEAVLDEIAKREEARRIEQQRCRLRALAQELETGSIVHRRAHRVEQMNQLRDEAVKELRAHAEVEGAPPSLPGPEASEWVEWACSLHEPQDTQSLQALRKGFARLDEFVANLEPGMWVMPDPALLQLAEEQKRKEAEAREHQRSRLLALADQLAKGRIEHHRAFRVNRANQLREQAIKDLRSQAKAEVPPTLPGPDAEQWIAWACSLKEPEDADSLRALRDGFPHLDDFVADLEPDMWVAAGMPAAQSSAQPEVKPRQEPTTPVPSRLTKAAAASAAAAAAAPAPIQTMGAASAVGHDEPPPPTLQEATHIVVEVDKLASNQESAEEEVESEKRPLVGIVTRLRQHKDPEDAPPYPEAELFEKTSSLEPVLSVVKARVGGLAKGQWRLLLIAAAVLVLAVGVALGWRSHRRHADSGAVKTVEAKAIEVAPPNPVNPQPAASAAEAAAHPASQLPEAKPSKTNDQKPAAANPQPATPAPQPPPPEPLNDTALRTPHAIPKAGAPVVTAEAAPPGGSVLGSVPGGAPSGPNNLINIVRNPSIERPNITAPQKVKVSSGVAQAMLIHQVAPEYPTAARESGIQGTVVLQAVIGKDGKVQQVRVLRGHPMLTQAAVNAVKQWRYKPFSVDGEPVEADIRINVNFTP